MRCSWCKIEKNLNCFYKNKCNKTGFTSQCKDCVNEGQKKYRVGDIPNAPESRKEYLLKLREKERLRGKEKYKKNKDAYRNQHYKSSFGITLEQYNILLNNQNNSCGICWKDKSMFDRQLSVDHCHSTNKIRGLLCIHCNSAIGSLREDVNIINRALEYLAKHKATGLIKKQ